MKRQIPDFSLVVLVGASGSGKSTFAARCFAPTEILSSDTFRAMVSDDSRDQSASADAFAALSAVLERRLSRRRLTVVDATNLRPEDRKVWIETAKRFHAVPVAVSFDVPRARLAARLAERDGDAGSAGIARRHADLFERSVHRLEKEGFKAVVRLDESTSREAALERVPLWTDKRSDEGPFDIVGDVHGCADELESLLARLGHSVRWSGEGAARRAEVSHPDGRRLVFVGDLVDRGPRSLDCIRIAMAAVAAGGHCVPGNHDDKLSRWLRGRPVRVGQGLATTVAEFEREPEFKRDAGSFLEGLVSHVWLDGGALAVAHAGIREDMIGRASGEIRAFCLYGDVAPSDDERPRRGDWAADYRGSAAVVYGHTVTGEAAWRNNTLCVDTGCVFGGSLTAVRWPEREIVSVPAARAYFDYGGPLPGPEREDDDPDLSDYLGGFAVETELAGSVRIDPARAAAAVEIVSRFSADPRWLRYLPATMSPSATTDREGLLEHPGEAFDYYRKAGAGHVTCQEKHMGSRAVLVIGRDPSVMSRRFGLDRCGVLLTRTGRPFFDDGNGGFLQSCLDAMDAAEFWSRNGTDWAMLDCELLPWIAKASGLVRDQFAPVAAGGDLALTLASDAFAAAAARGVDGASTVAENAAARLAEVAAFRAVLERFASDGPVRCAPFHVLATEGRVRLADPHAAHMEEADRLARGGAPFVATRRMEVDLADAESCARAFAWWDEITAEGAEGFVVKPSKGVLSGKRGLVQPALKVRGREYLRLVYGAEYPVPGNIARLKDRSLSAKRSRAVREFTLGLEGLKRLVDGKPLRETLECAMAILALESEPADPRL